MGTVETRSKSTPRCSSPSPETDKNELREALCALKRGTSEEGVVEVVKSRVFETKVSVQSDGCQSLADSEMNGVSSLLKMRGSGKNLFSYGGESDGSEKLNSSGGSVGVGTEERREDWKKSEDGEKQHEKIVTIDVPIEDMSENKDLEMDDSGDEGYGFSVGDFVWGKIKSHPWWPGRIYDPSDASDFALKMRQKNRLLVAYFGDGTFAWCHPSQLKPFEENFEDMVMQSSSRAFVNAVQEAVNEVRRLLDLKMIVAMKGRSEFTPLLADNYGIKEGVLVPEKGIERLTDVLIDPAELLSRVKQIAEIISITSILELEILKSRLSAFYLSRGGYKLPEYQVPQSIPGLEDKDETVNIGSGSKSAVEAPVQAPVQGPFEEDYSALPVGPKSGELSHPDGVSGNRPNHRIKQKSIAEILEEDKFVITKNKGGDATEKVIPRKKRTGREEDKFVITKNMEGDATEKVIPRKKRTGREEAMASKSVQKGKGLLPSTDQNLVSPESDVSGVKENSDKETLLQLKEKKKAFDNESASNGNKKQTDEAGKAKEQNENGPLSRERKKSKYLSPPFTVPSRDQKKGEIKAESPKASSKAQLTEPVTGASDQLLKSPVLNCNGEASQENFSNKLAVEQDRPDSSNYQTPENDENKTIDITKIQAPAGEVLSDVRYVAISPQIASDINSLEKFVDFIAVYRSSLYREGSYYKIYKKYQPGKKRKKPESDLGVLRTDQNQADHASPDIDSELKKRRRKSETTSGLPEEKQAAVSKTGKKTRKPESDLGALRKDQNQADHTSPVIDSGPKKRRRKSETTSGLPEDKQAAVAKTGKKTEKPESNLGALSKDQNQADHTSPDIDSKPKKRRRKNETTSGLPEEKQAAVAKTGDKTKPESDLGLLSNDQNQADHTSPDIDSKPKTRRRKNETISGLPEEKQASVAKTGKKGTDVNPSAAALVVSFGPGSSLPSKSDLITVYSKFGALNESETAMFSGNHTAQVFFLKASDAEKALSHSQSTSPFGSSEATFQLQYLSAGSKSRERGEKSKSKASPAKKKDKTPAKPGSEASKLNYIQQKLQSLTSMLAASDVKSPDMKTKLESEMKRLLEDVNKMVESSSS